MAKPPVETEESWETINVGLGREHDIESNGPFVGQYVETQVIPVEDKNADEPGTMRDSNAHIFVDSEGERRFIWGSYNLDEAMKEIQPGDTVRVEFKGREQFTGDRGPQSIKNYLVQRRKA